MSGFRGEKFLQKYVYDVTGGVDLGTIAEQALYSKANHGPIPLGSLVVDFYGHVVTEFDSAGDALTLDVGDADDPDGYAEDIAQAVLVVGGVVRAGAQAGAKIWDDTNDHMLNRVVDTAAEGQVSVSPVAAAATAGKMYLYFDCVRSFAS